MRPFFVESVGVGAPKPQVSRLCVGTLSQWRKRHTRPATGATLKCAMQSVSPVRPLVTMERISASPGMAWATLEAMFRIDVRPILSTITAPTLVIHAREHRCAPVYSGRYLADHISDALWPYVDGMDHAFWLTIPTRS
jgi:pimeloyl-ACP methyl ester carboxylesterase